MHGEAMQTERLKARKPSAISRMHLRPGTRWGAYSRPTSQPSGLADSSRKPHPHSRPFIRASWSRRCGDAW